MNKDIFEWMNGLFIHVWQWRIVPFGATAFIPLHTPTLTITFIPSVQFVNIVKKGKGQLTMVKRVVLIWKTPWNILGFSWPLDINKCSFSSKECFVQHTKRILVCLCVVKVGGKKYKTLSFKLIVYQKYPNYRLCPEIFLSKLVYSNYSHSFSLILNY